MLIDDLGTIASHKQDHEVVEAFDPALKSDPIPEKYGHIDVVVAKMLQEGVLKRWGALGSHV